MRQKANPKCQRSPADVEAVGIHVWKLQKRCKAGQQLRLDLHSASRMSAQHDLTAETLALYQYAIHQAMRYEYAE